MATLHRTVISLPYPPLLDCCPQCLHSRPKLARQLSSTPTRKAMRVALQSGKEMMEQMEKRKSRSVEMKNMPLSKIPDDLGLIPETFIRPPKRDMPRLFGKTWKMRLKVEWLSVKTRLANFASLVSFLYWSQRKLPAALRMPLELRSRPYIALALHQKFYSDLARGNLKSLKPILCAGLLATTQSQLAHRADSQLPPQSWHLVRYTSPLRFPFPTPTSRYSPFFWPLTSLLPHTQAKILSDRVVPSPLGHNTVIRQCVVRIRSLQSLDRHDGSPALTADLTEYFVIQRMRLHDKVQDWKVWGTTTATSTDQMERWVRGEGEAQQAAAKMSWMDRLRAADPPGGV